MLRPNKGSVVYSGQHSRLHMAEKRELPRGYQLSVVDCETSKAESMCKGGAGNPLGLG